MWSKILSCFAISDGKISAMIETFVVPHFLQVQKDFLCKQVKEYVDDCPVTQDTQIRS